MDNKVIKSLKEISWNVTEEEYRADSAYSYSTLARFHREGFDNLHKLRDKIESPSLLFGSVVDTILTGTPEEFDERFLVAEFPSIPDSQVAVINELHKRYGESCRTIARIDDNYVIQVANSLKFQTNWKSETIAKVIKEKGEEYYNLLTLAMGKTVISTETYQDALECISRLKNDKMTSWYFEPNNPFDKTTERLHQLKFKGEYDGISIRCMADLIIVDHVKKKILPIDLKTSYKKEWHFYNSFMEWGYWIQAQLYWEIIRQNLNKDDYFKDFELLSYRFIIVSNGNKKPLVWDYSDTKATIDCFYGKNKQFECRNWRGILKDLHYYLSIKPVYPLGIKNINSIVEWLNGK